MSADISDLARVQDEDVLRQMWQETEDFGRKKEIRSHMYKLREARLKDFYNSTEMNTKTSTTSCQKTTHADSLADQSYVTLKSKEVRDSESPTRDSYNKSIAKHEDQGWTVTASHEKSTDGKTHTSTQAATTSGTQKIDGGKLDYAAKLEEKATVFQDGDDQNYTRAVGTSSSSAVRQEAHGGDEHSNFRSSSSKTSSSSTFVSESRSASENLPSSTTAVPYSTINEENAKSVVERTYTTNIPSDLKNHPSYVEGRTKVTQETKTLADGTVVTTTRYETKHGNSTQTATHKKYSNVASSRSEQKSTTHQESSKHTSKSDQQRMEYVVEPGSSIDVKIKLDQKQLGLRDEKTTERTVKEDFDVRKSRRTKQDVVEYVEIPFELPVEQTKTTETRVPQAHTSVATKTTTTKTVVSEQVPQETIFTTKSTHMVNQQQDVRDTKQVVSDQLISTEKQYKIDTRTAKVPASTQPERAPIAPQEPYVQPDRRQPIKPGKSEMDQKPTPTEGQYDTTYRSDYTSKKISVEVSATHDAFARSLRSITPDRVTRGSPRGDSPEKMRYPSRSSPDRHHRSRSPRKSTDRFSSTETITYSTGKTSPSRKSPEKSTYPQKMVNGDISVNKTTKHDHYAAETFSSKSRSTIDSSTLTRRKPKRRSPSPTGTTTSDFEYVRNTQDVLTTDLDDVDYTQKRVTEETKRTDTVRPSSLDITTRKVKKVTERSPTSPLTELRSPVKEKSPIIDLTPTADRPKLIRTDTYEERVKEILGLTKESKETRRSSLERSSIKRSSFRETGSRTTSSDDVTKRLTKNDRKSPVKDYPSQTRKSPEKKPDLPSQARKSPEKTSNLPSQVRKSPEPYPDKKSPTKSAPSVQEFPSQVRKSPEKQVLEPYPDKETPSKTSPKIGEYPSQVRKSPEKQPLELYPERKSPTKTGPTVSEFPSQIRRSPERETLEPYPEKKVPTKSAPNISEFPSQVRKSPEKEPLEPYPEKKSPTKSGPTIAEFPSQIRRSPERETLEPYPEKKVPTKTAPSISEFPSQVRKSPEKEPLEPYPEKKSPTKSGPTIAEFPSQIRRSPERETREPYPEKKVPTKTAPSISEFPLQLGKSPKKEPLESYPEKKSPTKSGSTIAEFPSQIRRSPERETREPYPEKKVPTKSAPGISEFPSQIKKSPERKPGEPYPERPSSPKFTPSQVKKSPVSRKPSPKKVSESSSTSEEENVEETITETTVKSVESRIPVEEPIVEKKLFSQLCREEEVRKRLDEKKITQELIEAEILQNQTTKEQTQKTVKKDRPITNGIPVKDTPRKSPTKKVVSEVTTRVSSIRKETPKDNKKPLEKTPSRKTIEGPTKKDTPRTTVSPSKMASPKKTIYRVEKTKFVGQTEYQDEFSRVQKEPVRKPLKPVTKTSLVAIEKSEKVKEDKSIHLRSNRVDDKKKVTKTILVNGDISKPKLTDAPVARATTKKTPVSVTSIISPKEKTTVKKTKSQERFSTSVRKSMDVKSNKRHVVTATVTVAPKKKTPTTKPKKPTTSKPSVKPKTNGYVSSDTDEESVVESVEGSFVDLTEKRSQFSRTTSDQTFTTIAKSKQPEVYSDSEDATRKVITTKTVIITNEDMPNREIVVNLQRSKSSREPTPDRVCPRPLTSDEEEDLTPVRYPDEISEPDDGTFKRKPKKLFEAPIYETEDTSEYSRQKITKVDKVEETDESLLSIDKKISKFLNTADEMTKEPLKPRPSKVTRPSLEVSEDLREDECLLSVSDKVSKFISTAEQLSVTTKPERPKSPRPKTFEEGIQRKVSEFQTSVEECAKPKGVAPKAARPSLEDVDDRLKEDECLLSVSDKVSKFISTAEKLTSTTTPKSVSLSKIDVQPKKVDLERKSPNREVKFKTETSSSKNATDQFIHTEQNEEIRTRKSPSLSPERRRSPSPDVKTPDRRPSNQYESILKTDKTKTKETGYSTLDSTPKSTRRSSHDDTKTTLSSATRLRTTESVKRAKALFENIGKEQDTPWQKDILSRPSVFEAKRKTDQSSSRVSVGETRKSSLQKTDDKVETVTRRSQSPQTNKQSPERIEVTRFRSKSPEKVSEILSSQQEPRGRETTPEGDLPHYMKPLDRSLRPNSPHRDGINQGKPQQPQTVDQVDTRQTKFGVTLRRTDSGRATKTAESSTVTTERRKSSITLEKRITEEEIEEIFELEILEELLEKVVGYDLRRKIRAQIRLVKKLISEGTLEEYVSKRKSAPREAITRRGSSPAKTTKPDGAKKTEYQSTYVRKVSPERKPVDNKLYSHTDLTDRRSSVEQSSEYQSSYSYSERRASTETSTVSSRKNVSPVRNRSSPQRTSPERKVSKTVDHTPGGKVTTIKTVESVPGGLRTTTSKTTEKTFTSLKKTVPVSKKPVEDSQPEWVRQRNLRNARESAAPTGRKVTTSTSTSTSKKSILRTSPAKEVKGTDIITSSYGVGPTDENGAPLFGLRALRAQNKSEKVKVQGTVIRSEYYSENDQEPVGQVSVTKYSNDPKDLEQDGPVSTDGLITSVTTTQKFGYRDTPSLRSLTDNKKEICDKSESTTTKTAKINRRGSVKEMSKKFIDNAVETLKSERQTTYPKAGLILRSSSFKSTNGAGDSRETSPAEDRQAESSTVTVRTMKTSSGETFLTNKSKISGVQDVITRMKNEEYVEGESEEDIAARGLLNKFLGSQVILSGMEAAALSTKTTTSTLPSSSVRRSTKITTTVTEGGKPVTTTRVFQRPVTETEIETVWDEQTLKLLLEQSTDYEERRIVRSRLRQVMAEQEACTALVDEATRSEEPKTPTTPTTPAGQLEESVETTKEVKSEGDVTTTKVTTKVTQQQVRTAAAKPISPFAKFRQLDKQNSVNKPTPPSTPGTPRGSGPLFKFTDPALSQSASTIKDRLLHWCRMKTKEYENIQLDNFSSSWADGLAFCALIHHFLPDAFDYSALTPKDRKHNFELAFRIADEKADIFPLLDVEDMLETRRPDWKCVFTYVQAIYRRFKDED